MKKPEDVFGEVFKGESMAECFKIAKRMGAKSIAITLTGFKDSKLDIEYDLYVKLAIPGYFEDKD